MPDNNNCSSQDNFYDISQEQNDKCNMLNEPLSKVENNGQGFYKNL